MSRDYLLQENSVTYLCKLVSNLPKSVLIPKIESLYLARCCEIAERESITIPEILKSRFRCPRCFIQYKNGSLETKIQRPRRKNKFEQKLLNKITNEKVLTRYQQRYLKDNKNKGNFNSISLVEVCSFCKYKRKTCLEKPQKIRHQPEELPIKSKKKKKRDKFVGLNKEVVLNVQSGSSSKNEMHHDNKKSSYSTSTSALPVEKELSKNAKKRKLMALKDMLLNSKQQKRSSSLEHFLTSI
ncbi:hypothetical protein FQR65_LT02439 [Abscondita terminalis]|nr:hypothetical protein FQR65_LT02439 [Abscondita terminalis]